MESKIMPILNMIETGPSIEEKLILAVKSVSFLGLLTISALLASFNHKAFEKVFKKRGIVYWSLFFAFSVIPLMLILFLWNFFFLGKYGEAISAFMK